MELILCVDRICEDIEDVLQEERPFYMHVCEDMEEALEVAEGRWILLLDPGALPAADCFRLHVEAHRQMGRSVALLGAVELAVDSRTTPLLRVHSVKQFARRSHGADELHSAARRSASCNTSVPREALEAVDSNEIWRGGLEVALREGRGIKTLHEPALRVYRELELDLETFQSHCFQLGYNHFRLGSIYERPELLCSLVGADPTDEENWMLLRARLERQRDTIRSIWREAVMLDHGPLPLGEARVEMIQGLHGRLQRIGAHAYEVGQAVAATGISRSHVACLEFAYGNEFNRVDNEPDFGNRRLSRV